MPDYSPWTPISDSLDLKHLGKLGEEVGELSAAISRCIIQGMSEAEPVTGKINSRWLEEELADVLLNAELTMEHFGLDKAFIESRMNDKRPKLFLWHKMKSVAP